MYLFCGDPIHLIISSMVSVILCGVRDPDSFFYKKIILIGG